LSVFDAADGFGTCTRRLRSNTPLQALTLLNDEAFYECASALAARVLEEGPSNDAGRIDLAFRLCLGRPPAREESARLLELLAKESDSIGTNEQAGSGAQGSGTKIPAGEKREKEAWVSVARVLINLDETITRE
jgi:hypothetical protein